MTYLKITDKKDVNFTEMDFNLHKSKFDLVLKELLNRKSISTENISNPELLNQKSIPLKSILDLKTSLIANNSAKENITSLLQKYSHRNMLLSKKMDSAAIPLNEKTEFFLLKDILDTKSKLDQFLQCIQEPKNFELATKSIKESYHFENNMVVIPGYNNMIKKMAHVVSDSVTIENLSLIIEASKTNESVMLFIYLPSLIATIGYSDGFLLFNSIHYSTNFNKLLFDINFDIETTRFQKKSLYFKKNLREGLFYTTGIGVSIFVACSINAYLNSNEAEVAPIIRGFTDPMLSDISDKIRVNLCATAHELSHTISAVSNAFFLGFLYPKINLLKEFIKIK